MRDAERDIDDARRRRVYGVAPPYVAGWYGSRMSKSSYAGEEGGG